MKEYQNEKGLWQSVEDNQIAFAKEKVDGDLQLLIINDFYKGYRIDAVTFEDDLPDDVINEIGTNQAVLFCLNPRK